MERKASVIIAIGKNNMKSSPIYSEALLKQYLDELNDKKSGKEKSVDKDLVCSKQTELTVDDNNREEHTIVSVNEKNGFDFVTPVCFFGLSAICGLIIYGIINFDSYSNSPTLDMARWVIGFGSSGGCVLSGIYATLYVICEALDKLVEKLDNKEAKKLAKAK